MSLRAKCLYAVIALLWAPCARAEQIDVTNGEFDRMTVLTAGMNSRLFLQEGQLVEVFPQQPLSGSDATLPENAALVTETIVDFIGIPMFDMPVTVAALQVDLTFISGSSGSVLFTPRNAAFGTFSSGPTGTFGKIQGLMEVVSTTVDPQLDFGGPGELYRMTVILNQMPAFVGDAPGIANGPPPATLSLVHVIPEPSSILFWGFTGVVGCGYLLGRRRRRARHPGKHDIPTSSSSPTRPDLP